MRNPQFNKAASINVVVMLEAVVDMKVNLDEKYLSCLHLPLYTIRVISPCEPGS